MEFYGRFSVASIYSPHLSKRELITSQNPLSSLTSHLLVKKWFWGGTKMAHNDQQMALKLLLNGCLLNFSVYQILILQVLEMSFGFVG